MQKTDKKGYTQISQVSLGHTWTLGGLFMNTSKKLYLYGITFLVLAGCHTPAGDSGGELTEGGRAGALVADLYSAIHTGSPVFVVATAQKKPQRLLCQIKGCEIIVDRDISDEEVEPSGGTLIERPSATQWVTLHVSDVLAGRMQKDTDINAVNSRDCSSQLADIGGDNSLHLPELWPLMDKSWDKQAIYRLRRTHAYSPGDEILSDISCDGDVDIQTPYTFYGASWKDSGGYGWYTIEDVKKLVSYLRTHKLPERGCQRAQLWVDVTGNPIPDEGISGCPY